MDYSKEWEAHLEKHLIEAFSKYDPFRHRFLDCTIQLAGTRFGWNLPIDPAHSADDQSVWKEIMRRTIRDRMKDRNPQECEITLRFE